jgi:F-box and leucine-rich repeat protein 9
MTGLGMFDQVNNYEENPTAATSTSSTTPSQSSLAGEGVDNETLRRMMAVRDETVQFKKISLRSKAEEEIVNDAKRKKAMQEMCEQNLLASETSGYSIARLRGLRVLKLAGCNRISDVSLKYSFRLPELRELSLAKCQQVSIDGIQPLVRNCPSLEVLDLSECHNVTDKAVELITQHLHRLSNFSLERCAQLTDFSLDYIAINCKNLKVSVKIGVEHLYPN